MWWFVCLVVHFCCCISLIRSLFRSFVRSLCAPCARRRIPNISHYCYYIVDNIYLLFPFCHFRMSAYKFNLENCCYELSINGVIARRKYTKKQHTTKSGSERRWTTHVQRFYLWALVPFANYVLHVVRYGTQFSNDDDGGSGGGGDNIYDFPPLYVYTTLLKRHTVFKFAKTRVAMYCCCYSSSYCDDVSTLYWALCVMRFQARASSFYSRCDYFILCSITKWKIWFNFIFRPW